MINKSEKTGFILVLFIKIFGFFKLILQGSGN